MPSYCYLASLLLALVGLLATDYRWKLAYFVDRIATLISLLIGVVVFSAWDLTGIAASIFFVGPSPYLTGLRLAPEYPVEEAVFLTVLCYSALLIYKGVILAWPRISR